MPPPAPPTPSRVRGRTRWAEAGGALLRRRARWGHDLAGSAARPARSPAGYRSGSAHRRQLPLLSATRRGRLGIDSDSDSTPTAPQRGRVIRLWVQGRPSPYLPSQVCRPRHGGAAVRARADCFGQTSSPQRPEPRRRPRAGPATCLMACLPC